jgi:hypothetical protein
MRTDQKSAAIPSCLSKFLILDLPSVDTAPNPALSRTMPRLLVVREGVGGSVQKSVDVISIVIERIPGSAERVKKKIQNFVY